MPETPLAIIVLAAGKGTRMRSAKTKVLHEIGGQPMIERVLDTAASLSPAIVAVVVGDHAPEVGVTAQAHTPAASTHIQSPPLGTAHAVMQALPALEDFTGSVMVLYADTPLVTAETLTQMHRAIADGAGAAVLGFSPPVPGAYGRLKLDEAGLLNAIVEAKDASPEELEIGFCNSGVMAFNAEFLKNRLKDVGNDNAKSEYYLTDMIALARTDGLDCLALEADTDEVLGVNSREELAQAELLFQSRFRSAVMENGATLIDPESVFFSYDTQIGSDVRIEPNVFFGRGVRVEDGAEIKAFSHIEAATIGKAASIGPFARLRPGADIGDNSKVGNFVEIKKASLGEGAKVSHLTYIGDAEIGADANIGAGTITCNYDGYGKHKTTIGKGAFIGSNSSLVAPVTIGAGAYVGSGSVITKDVDEDDLAVSRARQSAIKGWAGRFRNIHQKKD